MKTASWRVLLSALALALCCLLAPACLGSPKQYPEPLFSAQTVTVFMTGLPGDAESENTYDNELGSWLDVVVAQGAGKCVVLCDRPGAMSDRTNSRIQAIQGDREHFLRLPEMLAAGTNPVTIVVWGHGGKQGSAAVFHVRGPRITPEDFANSAAKLSGKASRWILMFRGSGAFARAMSGENRQILSSEESTAFASDPNGMPLLIKAAKAQPRLDLAQLATSFGSAVADWYSQRRLARTEEPTLWVDGDAPKTMGESQNVVADHHEPTQLASSDTEPHGATEPQAGSTDWSRVPRVSASKYPEADAVVLSARQVCFLGSDPALVTEREEFIQVLKPEGKRVGDFDIAYCPPEEELDFVTCEVLQPDGRVSGIDPEDVGEVGSSPEGVYGSIRRKVFSLPGVSAGSVVHVKRRSQWKNYPMPRVTMDFPIAGEFPTMNVDLEVRLPKTWPLHYLYDGERAPEPQTGESGYSASYHWHWADVPADLREPLSAPRKSRSLSISTFKDWTEFTGWYSHITQLTGEMAPEIVAKANELTREAHSQREQVQRLYSYVTSLRYVAAPLGISAVRPHAAVEVLRNQFGDCKDKANLLNSLLHVLNIQADLVLVPRFRDADESLPGFAFNHAISRVVSGGQTLWLDPTDEVCRFGLLPPGDSGRNVLVVGSDADHLTRLPTPKPEDHRLQLRGQVFCLPGGVALAKLVATATGCVDYQLRSDAHDAKRSIAATPLLARRYHPVAGVFGASNQIGTAVSEMESDYAWSAEGDLAGLLSISGEKYTVHSPLWLPREWDLALSRRQTPLFLNDGYPLSLDEQFEIVAPADSGSFVLPQTAANDREPLRWQVSWTRAGEGKLTARLQATLVTGTLTKRQTDEFQQQLQALRGALAADSGFNTASHLTQR